MKKTFYWLTLGPLAFLTACTFNPAPLALQPVGPRSIADSATVGNGGLVVFSAWDPLANLYVRDHSDYKILSTNGTLVRRVTNALYSYDNDPVPVELPAGQYQVLAMSEDAGKVLVPVRIAAGQATSVYLDGYEHLRASQVGRDSVVKLPNGEIVGWAAKE